MRTALLVMAVAAWPATPQAQVSTNQHALDQLGPAAKPHAHAARAHQAGHAHARAVTRSQPASTAARIGKAPPIPLHPPPPPVIAPPALHVDLHPPPPPPPVPVVAAAVGTATPIHGGVRITFGAGSADVNARTDAAVHGIAVLLKAEPNTVVDVDAFASGTEDDPSSPRRLSLARALAARAVLIHDGIASTRIYARAFGMSAAPDSDPRGPANRADLVVQEGGAGTPVANPPSAALAPGLPAPGPPGTGSSEPVAGR